VVTNAEPQAQRPAEAVNAIRLQARTLTPQPGLEANLQSHFQGRLKARESKVHVILQFRQQPNLQQRQALAKEMDVQLLDALPLNAFFAVMPPDISRAQMLVGTGRPVRWVGRIATEYKISPPLARGTIPAHARRAKGTAEVMVLFFGDVDVKDQRDILGRHVVINLNRVEPLNGWRVQMDPKAIATLAGRDEVKWIVEVPPPPEDDNDGVRSATGVNADVVLAPSIYNLTGAGVVIAQWESRHASLVHGDLAGRLALADPPLSTNERSETHSEAVLVNNQFDNGEAVYIDMDDDTVVSVGDIRSTAVGAFAAGSAVAAGNADIGTGLVLFLGPERYVDSVVADFAYTAGEPIYLDNDGSGAVSVGDRRITAAGGFAAGTVVALGNADIGQALRQFRRNPHYHATHVAGTVLGSGARSAALGGTPSQWKGVAPGATLRSYSGDPTLASPGAPVAADEYFDAAVNGVTISTNSWGSTHCHQIFPPNTCYDIGSQYYDSVISGRRSDGTPSGLGQRILILGSAGNRGTPERHSENVLANGQYDNGESIYMDNDDSGTVSAGDTLRFGPAQPLGTALINFNLNEVHNEDPAAPTEDGIFDNTETIYRDADGSRTVTVGDTRITAGAGFAAGSVVAVGNADVGRNLRQFRFWGNVRIPNSAKNTLEIANIRSDNNTPDPTSSRGPTDDGRQKPDLASPGSQAGGDGGVTSTWPRNLYFTISGTSMATPAVAGGAALLTEWYRSACVAGTLAPDTLRALLVHSALDLVTIPTVAGNFAGPDFSFGYGRVRIKEAADLIAHHRIGSATAVGNTDYTVTVGAMGTLKATLAWDDPPWTANAAPGAVTGILQNDLDLVLIAPDGRQYTPWQISANPFAPSTVTVTPAASPIPAAARDRRNTIEQVVVNNAVAGTWTIRVTASTLNLPPQGYTVVSETLPAQTSPCSATPAADIWLRDNPADTGAVPSSGDMWLGPDIWNRYSPDGATAHENPEYGGSNYLYANVRNASAVQVNAGSLDFWIAEAALGLIWPQNFVHVGRIPVPNLAPGEVRQVGPLPWTPPSPSASDHYCMYARLASPQDPITFAEGTSVRTNAMNSNNIAYRNLIIVDLSSSKSVPFLVRNVEVKEADVDIVFRVPQGFLKQGQVFLRLSPELERQWPKEHRAVKGLALPKQDYQFTVDAAGPEAKTGQPLTAGEQKLQEPTVKVETPPYQITEPEVVIRGVRMASAQAERMTLTFTSALRTHSEHEVHVIQQVHGTPIGGIVFRVRTGRSNTR
jgi:hypothetical protein